MVFLPHSSLLCSNTLQKLSKDASFAFFEENSERTLLHEIIHLISITTLPQALQDAQVKAADNTRSIQTGNGNQLYKQGILPLLSYSNPTGL